MIVLIDLICVVGEIELNCVIYVNNVINVFHVIDVLTSYTLQLNIQYYTFVLRRLACATPLKGCLSEGFCRL